MLCLLSAEGYKLKKSKSFFVSAVVMTLVVVLMYGILLLLDGVVKGEIENGTAGVIVTQEDRQDLDELESGSVWEQIGIMDIMRQVFSGNLASCVLAVYVSIVVVSEYSSGMIKNIVGKGNSRTVIFMSKLIMAVLSSLLLLLISCAMVLAFGMIFIGKSSFAGGFLQNLMLYIGIQMLLNAALAALYVLIAEVARSYAAGISASIGAAVFPTLLFTGLDVISEKYGLTLSSYWVVTRSETCPLSGITADFVLETVLVSAVWFLISVGLGIWHFNKTDVK